MSDRGVGHYTESHIGNGKAGRVSLPNTVEEKSTIGAVPLQEAGYEALQRYLRRLRKSLAILEAADDADAIHDARVAVRELRAVAAFLEPSPCFNGKWLHQLDKGLRHLAQTLGTVRDTDVFLEHLESYVAQHEAAGEQLAWLQHALRLRRKKATRQVHKALENAKTRQLLKRTQRRLERLQHTASADRTATKPAKTSGSGQSYPLLLRHFAGSAIWGRYQEILSYEMALPEAGAETLHKLRIACKRLRYSIQIFGLTPAALLETVAALKAAQDELGQLHDVFYADQLTRELWQASSPGTEVANRSYQEFLDSLLGEGQQLRASIGPLWQRLTGLPMRQAIAGFIAAL